MATAQKSIKKNYLLLSLIILFLASSLYLTSNLQLLFPPLMGLSLFLIMLSAFFGQISFKFNKSLIAVFGIFVLLSMGVLFKHYSAELFLGIFALIACYVTLVIIAPNSLGSSLANKTIFNALMLSSLPLLIVPLTFSGFMVPYQGFFYNPASYGSIAVTIFAAILAYLSFFAEKLIKRETYHWLTYSLVIISLALIGLLVIISRSRTSLIALIVLLVLSLSIYIGLMINNSLISTRKLRRFVFIVVVSVFLVTLIYALTPNFMDYVQEVAIKTVVKYETEGLLDPRGEAWSVTLREASLFGHGREYFKNLGLGAHNTFVSLLGQYGFFSAAFFMMFIYLGYREAVRYCKNVENDGLKYFPLYMITTFFVLSLGEGMMMKASMFATFGVIGAVSINNIRGPGQINSRKIA